MAVSQEQKVDFLLKKLGFTKTKTGLAVDSTLTGTKKAGFAEAIPSPLIIANSSVWNEADSIPATPPGSDTNQVRVYLAATSGHRMTVDTTVANNRAFIAFSTYNDTSSARLDNWIDTQFGAGYLIKVFKGDPNSGGVQLSAAGSGQNDGWFFDYSAGVLNFNDTNVPSGVSATNIYVVGYRYIGQTGAPTSGISTFSFLDLTVERNLDVGVQGGISTFRNDIDLNADLDVDGHTNLDNVSVAGVTTFNNLVKINKSGTSELTSIYNNNAATLAINDTGAGAQIVLRGQSPKLIFDQTAGGNGSVYYDSGDLIFYKGVPVGSPSAGEVVRFNNSGVSVSGIVTATGADINGDLDVDGHTNLDNVSVAGITTFSEGLFVPDNKKIELGNASGSGDLQIYHDGNQSVIKDSGTGQLLISGENTIAITNAGATANYARFIKNAQVELFHNNIKRLETTSVGVSIPQDLDVDGHTNLDNVSIAGVITATTFVGDGDFFDLDVDGQTTLDHVTISGVTTTGQITAQGNIRAEAQIQIFSNLPTIVLSDTNSENDFNIKNNNGVFTVQDTDSNTDRFKINSSGQATITGDLDVTRHLDVDGHTDLDNVSIAGFTTITQDLNVDGHTNLDNVSIAGVTTMGGNLTISNATPILYFIDTGANPDYHIKNNNGFFDIVDGTNNATRLTISNTGELTVSGNSNFGAGIDVTGNANVTGNLTVGGVLTYEDVKNVDAVGLITARSGVRVTGGVIEAQAGENKIPSLYAAMGNLPSAGSYHGMFAHVHATGRGYFAHAGNWLELVNKEVNGVVGTGTERYNIGPVDLTTLDVSGISTFAGNVDINADIDVDGHTNLDNVSASGILTAQNFDYTTNRNIRIGAGAAHTTTRYNIIAIGEGAAQNVTSDGIVALGYNAGNLQTSGSSNTYIGSYAGEKITNKNANTFVGDTAGRYVTSHSNTAVGAYALRNFNGGSQSTYASNCAFGRDSMRDATTASTNAAYGNGSLQSVGGGQSNAAFGHESLKDCSGQYNTGVGRFAGKGLSTGQKNTILGAWFTGNQLTTGSNNTLLGFNATPTSTTVSNEVTIGDTNVTKFRIPGIGVTFSTSGNIIPYNTTFNNDIDVDGHTNLDNVNIVGVTTTTDNIHIGTRTHTANSSTALKNIHMGSEFWNGSAGDHRALKLIFYGPSGSATQYGFGVSNSTLELQSNGHISMFAGGVSGSVKTRRFHITSGGDYLFDSGTLYVQDKIGHYNDANTNIRFPLNDTISFETAATERLRITNQGNISVTNDLDVDGHTNLDNVSIAGVTTFAGAIDANGDLDVDGHTNLDNVSIAGVSTFSDTVHVGAAVTILSNGRSIFSGITTFNQGLEVPFYKSLNIGNSLYGKIHYPTGGSALEMQALNQIKFKCWVGNNFQTGIHISGVPGQVKIGGYNMGNNGSKQPELSVTGHTTQTITMKSSDGTNLTERFKLSQGGFNFTGLSTHLGNFDLDGDIDVDGHTNLDNLSVAGVSTFNNDVTLTGVGGNTPDSAIWDYSDKSLNFGNSAFLKFGSTTYSSGQQLQIYQSGSIGFTIFKSLNNNQIAYQNDRLFFNNQANNTALARIESAEGVSLYYTGTKRFQTSGIGVTVTGTVVATGADINGDLDVDGHTNLDNVSIAGVTTFASNAIFNGTAQFNSTIGVHDGTTGGSGQYLRATGTGVTWASFPSMRTSQSFTASAGQTTFNFTYNVGFLDVFVNGIKLSSSEFTANNGSSVVLSVGSFVGDIVELVSYFTTSYAAGDAEFTELVQDTSPQLGGDLDLFNKSITGTGNVNITGVITATQFKGDGSGLTGIVASGSGVIVKNSGTTVGTAGTIDFGTNLSVSPISSGIVTITASGSGGGSGISTISGVVNIANDLDVDGHTNLDNVSIAGVTTAFRIRLEDNRYIQIGNSSDLQLYHDGSHSYVNAYGGTGNLYVSGNSVRVQSNDNRLVNLSGTDIIKTDATTAYLYHNGSVRMQTSSVGITVNNDLDVDGHTELDNVNIAGVVTATTFKGALQGTSGTFSSGVDITGDLDVDGHTDLDNLNVAGVSTFTGVINASGGLTGTASVAQNLVVEDESSDTSCNVLFTTAASGNLPAKTGTNLTFNSATGNLTATKFTGDGSGLTGVTASGSGVVVQHDGSNIGTAGTINFSTNLDVSAISAGIVTITASGGLNHIVEDTSPQLGGYLDSNGHNIQMLDNDRLRLGTSFDLDIYHDGNHSYIDDSGTGNLYIQSNHVNIDSKNGEQFINCIQDGAVEIYHNNSKKIETTSSGATVTGTLTATAFSGDGSALTGISGGTNVGITTNLSGSFTASAGSPSTINTFGYGSGDIVVEYTVFIKNGSDFQTQKLLAMRDGTTIHSTQFAVMFSSSLLVQLDATISSGNILLRATPETGVSGSTTYKIKREVM